METNKVVYSARIQKAINLAIKTHELDEQQKRKGKEIPYVTHPLTVGLILSRAGASEDVVIAGILHDTIEDSSEENKVTYELIQEMFGTEVADLVLSVTETDKGLSWDERKAAALEHIAHFSEGSVLVKSADILSNGHEILADYALDGEKVFGRFNRGKDLVLGNYLRVASALVSRWPESPLAGDLELLSSALRGIGSVTYRVDAHSLLSGEVLRSLTIEAVDGQDATDQALQILLREEMDGTFLDAPGQYLIAEIVKPE